MIAVQELDQELINWMEVLRTNIPSEAIRGTSLRKLSTDAGLKVVQPVSYDEVPSEWENKLVENKLEIPLGECFSIAEQVRDILDCDMVIGILGIAYACVKPAVFWHCWNKKDGIHFDAGYITTDYYPIMIYHEVLVSRDSNEFSRLIGRTDRPIGILGKAEKSTKRIFRNYYRNRID